MTDPGKSNIWYNLSLLSQLAVSFLTPVFLMIYVGTWVKNQFGLGDWVVLVSILLGLGSGISTVWKILKKSIEKDTYGNQ